MSVPGWVYKRYAMGEISENELVELEKMASDLTKGQTKQAMDFIETLKENPRSDELEDAFNLYEKKTGKSRNDMSQRDILNYVRKSRSMKKTAGMFTPDYLSEEEEDANLREYFGSDDEVRMRAQPNQLRRLGSAGLYGAGLGTLLGVGGGGAPGAVAGVLGGGLGGYLQEMADEDEYRNELHRRGLHLKQAEAVSRLGRAGAEAAVADKSNNLHKVLKAVPDQDKDDVLRALRQMKKQAAHCAPHKSSVKKRLKLMKKTASAEDYLERRKQLDDMQKLERKRALYSAGGGIAGAAVGSALSSLLTPGPFNNRLAYMGIGGTGGSLLANRYNINKQKELEAGLQKRANIGQAAGILGAAAAAPILGGLAMKGIQSFTDKTPAHRQQDLQRVLEVHPDIGRPEDPRVQMGYATLTRLNPSYAEDPLIAGPLLKQIVESRMDPMDPNSSPVMDAGIAKQLSEVNKTISQTDSGGLGGAVGQAVGRGFASQPMASALGFPSP